MIPLLERPPDVTKHPHAWTATRIRAYSAQELEVRPSSKGRTSFPPDTRSPSLGARPSGPGAISRSHSTYIHRPSLRASGPAQLQLRRPPAGLPCPGRNPKQASRDSLSSPGVVKAHSKSTIRPQFNHRHPPRALQPRGPAWPGQTNFHPVHDPQVYRPVDA